MWNVLLATIRRECLDYVIVFNEASLCHHLKSFVTYYHQTRTHLGLDKDTPESRAVQPPDLGPVIAVPQVGGLHHRYERLHPGPSATTAPPPALISRVSRRIPA